MAERKSICIKFNFDNPSHRKAYEIIKNENSNNGLFYADIISTSVIKYYEHLKNIKDDPYFETRLKEDEFAKRILEKLDKKLEKELPSFLISLIASFAIKTNNQSAPNTNEITSNEIAENTDIDWDFLGNE